jgi:hypothetical protein
MADQRVRVGVRVRPLLPHELEAGAESVIKADRSSRIIASIPAKKNAFDFDWAFGPFSDHREVYDSMCRPLVSSVYEGYNATVFAYGQTGSGKTHTMGNAADATEGIIPFAIADIFREKILLESKSYAVSLEMSFMEVYMEECYDLFNAERKKIELRESSKGETYPEGLTIRPVLTLDDVQTFLAEASQIRSTGRTAMNAHSSRSHAVCTFYLGVTEPFSTRKTTSKLYLVDLAGSERAKKTMATGDVFAEGVSINKGLLALGNVIVALSTQNKENSAGGTGAADASNKKNHVPYRDSKITRLLKDSLGGNGKTVMLACVSPADVNFEETLNTLRFASRASTIVNSASVNVDESEVSSDDLMKELNYLRTENKSLRSNLEALKSASSSCDDGMSAQLSYTARMSCERVKSTLLTINDMVTTQKSLLVRCLEEDIELSEDDVLNMFRSISAAKSIVQNYLRERGGSAAAGTALEAIDSADADFASSFLPPIMKLIEDFDVLQSELSLAAAAAAQEVDELDAICAHQSSGGRGRELSLQQHSLTMAAPCAATLADDEFSSGPESAVDKILSACAMDVDERDETAGAVLLLRTAAADGADGWCRDASEAAVKEKEQNLVSIAQIAEQVRFEQLNKVSGVLIIL